MIKGMMRKKSNPFGMQGDIPDDIMHPGGGIGGGAYGVGSGSPEAINEAPKPGFFGQGGVGRGIAGTLGDFLLQQSGNRPIYQPAMRQQGAIRAQQQQAEAKRFASNQDWKMREDYKRDNPKPANNDTINDYNFIREKFGDEKAREFIENNLVNPSFYTGNDGRRYSNPTGQAPTAPVGKLRPIGGPASQSPGNFRP